MTHQVLGLDCYWATHSFMALHSMIQQPLIHLRREAKRHQTTPAVAPNDACRGAPKQLSPIAKRCWQQCQTTPQPFSDRQTGASLGGVAGKQPHQCRRKRHGLTTLQVESNRRKQTPFPHRGSSLSLPTTTPFFVLPKPESLPFLMASISP